MFLISAQIANKAHGLRPSGANAEIRYILSVSNPLSSPEQKQRRLQCPKRYHICASQQLFDPTITDAPGPFYSSERWILRLGESVASSLVGKVQCAAPYSRTRGAIQ